MASKVALLLFLLLFPIAGFAVSETFKGMLIPESFGPPIPIIIELENSAGKLSGRVKTSFPLKGEGPIISGEKKFDICHLQSDFGGGVILGFVGDCNSTAFEGKYNLYRRDGNPSQGKFRLKREQPDKGKKNLSESERRNLSATTGTACLRSNTMCLAACPRDDYNAQFLCANSCRHQLAACKAKGKKLLETPAAGPT